MKTAAEPFRFYARFTLTLVNGHRASTLQELRDGVAAAAGASIYEHTHRFVAEHESLVPEPPNDFALWVEEALQESALGERLAAVDTLRASSPEDLRRELLRILDEGLAEGRGRAAPPGREFHFRRAVRFSVPTGTEARDLAGFGEAVAEAGPGSLFLHLYESHLRPPHGVNDFSVWLVKELGEDDLARAIASLDLYRHTLEDVRKAILDMVRTRLEFAAARKEDSRAAT